MSKQSKKYQVSGISPLYKSSNNSQYQYPTQILSCSIHPPQQFTHICLVDNFPIYNQKCQEPLCPECVTNHIKLHQNRQSESQIENIISVRDDSQKQLLRLKAQIISDSEKFKIKWDSSSYYERCQAQINSIYQQIVQIVDGYFEQLNNQLVKSIKSLDQLQINQDNLQQTFEDEINRIEGLIYELQGPNFVRGILKYLIEDNNQVTNDKKQKLNSKFQEIVNKYEMLSPKIGSDLSSLDQLKKFLTSICYIKKSEPMRPIQISNNFQMPTVLSSIYDHFPTKMENSTKIEFKLQVENHFKTGNQEKNEIVMFEEDTKRYYKFAIYGNDKCQIVSKHLKNNIPLNHRAITTSAAEHFIIGGIYREKNRYRASHEVYQLVEEEEGGKLEEVSSMNFGRAMQGVCQLGNFIFAISGTQTNDENSSFNKCEKFDLETRVWSPIADCLIACSGCVVAPFNQRYIVKIGGKINLFTPCNVIEFYDIFDNEWVNNTELKFKFQGPGGFLRLPYNACAVTLGESEILIFGGSVHDVKSSEASILQLPKNLRKNSEVLINSSKQIPRPIEFRTQVALIEYDMIWVFADIRGQAKLLKGQEAGWIET